MWPSQSHVTNAISSKSQKRNHLTTHSKPVLQQWKYSICCCQSKIAISQQPTTKGVATIKLNIIANIWKLVNCIDKSNSIQKKATYKFHIQFLGGGDRWTLAHTHTHSRRPCWIVGDRGRLAHRRRWHREQNSELFGTPVSLHAHSLQHTVCVCVCVCSRDRKR